MNCANSVFNLPRNPRSDPFWNPPKISREPRHASWARPADLRDSTLSGLYRSHPTLHILPALPKGNLFVRRIDPKLKKPAAKSPRLCTSTNRQGNPPSFTCLSSQTQRSQESRRSMVLPPAIATSFPPSSRDSRLWRSVPGRCSRSIHPFRFNSGARQGMKSMPCGRSFPLIPVRSRAIRHRCTPAGLRSELGICPPRTGSISLRSRMHARARGASRAARGAEVCLAPPHPLPTRIARRHEAQPGLPLHR
jgi:hypothetical protein